MGKPTHPHFLEKDIMDQLIPITGIAKSYTELCTRVAEPGEFFNVLEGGLFVTYCKQDTTEIGDIGEETDVINWFQVKAELDNNVRPNEGDVYIIGLSAPYTRWKAKYVDYKLTWVEDGTEDKKIVKKYKSQKALLRAQNQPEEGIYYSVGEQAPYKVYGVVSSWEPVGSFISYVVDDMKQLLHKPCKSNPGEIAFLKGKFLVYNGEGWEQIDIIEPIENVYDHIYVDRAKNKYKLREGRQPGTVEFYSPRS